MMPPKRWENDKERMEWVRSRRRVVLRKMGDQPKIEPAKRSTPIETPNPILETKGDPVVLPPPPKPPGTEKDELRPWPVVEADLDELMEWGLPRYQQIYPDCTEETVRPMLILACRGGRMKFLRTQNVCSLFIAETTPWRPKLFVYQVFIVARISSGDGVYKEAMRLVRANERWATEIGAVGFQFGRGELSLELRDNKGFLDRLSRIIPDRVCESYIKLLNQPAPVTETIPPGVRMAAMGIPMESSA